MIYNPVADVDGIDWIALNLLTNELRKVQQKGRLIISKKYVGKHLWIFTKIRPKYYFIKHDKLMETKAGKKAQLTPSWKKGDCHWPKPPQHLLDEIDKYSTLE